MGDRVSIPLAAALLVVAAGCRVARQEARLFPDARPNLVLIVADDLRPDVLGVAGNPTVRTPEIDRLAREGAYFPNAFVVSPQCCPSRATILTGTYGHVNGVHDNASRLDPGVPTFPERLHDAGYETAFIGKWHIGGRSDPQPGFDRWVAFEEPQGGYSDASLNVDGVITQSRGYSTKVLTDYAVDWIRSRHTRPFLLVLAPKSVHQPLEPARRYARSYAGAPVDLPQSWADSPDRLPSRIRERFADKFRERETDPAGELLREKIRSYWRMVPSVDDSIGRLRAALERRDILDHTVMAFTSDSGFVLGEHGLRLKGRGFEPAIRVPLIVRYPPLVAAGLRPGGSVLDLDLAPTLLDLAGLPAAAGMQGLSLRNVFGGAATAVRRSWLFVQPYRFSPPASVGVRTERFKYLFHSKSDGAELLFDLVEDPEEATNLAGEPRYDERLESLRDELRRLLADNRAPAEWGPPP